MDNRNAQLQSAGFYWQTKPDDVPVLIGPDGDTWGLADARRVVAGECTFEALLAERQDKINRDREAERRMQNHQKGDR